MLHKHSSRGARIKQSTWHLNRLLLHKLALALLVQGTLLLLDVPAQLRVWLLKASLHLRQSTAHLALLTHTTLTLGLALLELWLLVVRVELHARREGEYGESLGLEGHLAVAFLHPDARLEGAEHVLHQLAEVDAHVRGVVHAELGAVELVLRVHHIHGQGEDMGNHLHAVL